MTEQKFYHFLLLFILLFSVACSNSEGQHIDRNIADDMFVDEAVFHATVVEVESGLMVTPLETEAESRSSDLMMVGIKDALLLDKQENEISLSDLEVGNTLKIIYDGIIMESYPAQINSHQVKIIDEE